MKRDDRINFLLKVYFNSIDLESCIVRAYLDFCRTLRGFASHQHKSEVYDEAKKFLINRIAEVKYTKLSQNDFDHWHELNCRDLIQIFQNFPFKVGQAQKWINMSMKYVFIMGLQGFEQVYRHCHCPIDNIILGKLGEKYGSECLKLSSVWSKLQDYDEYLSFQKWLRSEYKESALQVDLELWEKD